MPKRTDLRHVLVIGSGPIVIGQACEFDYSGTQACRVLRAEGLRVSLVNSNPATIMTDPEFADATYVEPITPEFVEQVIAKERPDALLATLGGQTALNTAVALHEAGVLEKYGVELIGADIDAIRRGEDRQLFKDIVAAAGGETPRSRSATAWTRSRAPSPSSGLPVVIRPSFTMGGLGSGMAHTDADLERLAGGGPGRLPVHEVLIEESVLGWKEFELELMRDKHDNVVVVCSIENVDAMGRAHRRLGHRGPGDDADRRGVPRLRDLGIAVLREVGVDTGGCNIQFAVTRARPAGRHRDEPPGVPLQRAGQQGDRLPDREDRGEARHRLHLDEIPNDITLKTPAAFEPRSTTSVVKIPRFAFEKFPVADPS
jgi:carbamoyl-phosphate synthase large subunit